MSVRARRALASVVAVVALLLGACGLDDGARVRNQDNVRDGDSADSDAAGVRSQRTYESFSSSVAILS